MKIKIKRNRNYTAVWVLWCALSGVLWLLLLGLKAAGAVRMSWPAAVLGIIWISWLTLALFAAAGSVLVTAARLKRWHRRRKVDRRIIRQAKAAGVWNKRPTPLGGRALELKAWEDFKIRRLPGETDAELRRRCMAKADNQLANAPK